jgi:hypothetical protein
MPHGDISVLIANRDSGGTQASTIASLSAYDGGSLLQFQKTWTIQFGQVPGRYIFKSVKIYPSLTWSVQGQGGSWVINVQTKELLGVLVATCIALGEAYMIPARDIIDNIKATRGVKVARLPTADRKSSVAKA